MLGCSVAHVKTSVRKESAWHYLVRKRELHSARHRHMLRCKGALLCLCYYLRVVELAIFKTLLAPEHSKLREEVTSNTAASVMARSLQCDFGRKAPKFWLESAIEVCVEFCLLFILGKRKVRQNNPPQNSSEQLEKFSSDFCRSLFLDNWSSEKRGDGPLSGQGASHPDTCSQSFRPKKLCS